MVSGHGPTQPQRRRRLESCRSATQPLEANANQALLEQVRFPKTLPILALVAYSKAGAVVDLTSKVSADGTLDWTAPEGAWTLYGVFLGWHGKIVERAAPGGEGYVIDHFSHDSIGHYLSRFERAFAGHPLTGLRAFFNDSYEVDDAEGQSDGTTALFDEFQKRRGYDLRRYLPALFGCDKIRERSRAGGLPADRVRPAARHVHRRLARMGAASGAVVRNQAHGAPANLLDLYAASDIPRQKAPRSHAPAGPLGGSRRGPALVSAEAATWLDEHFRTTRRSACRRRPLLRLRRQPHRLSRHRRLAARRSVARMAVLRIGRVQFAQSMVEGLSCVERLRDARSAFLQAGTPDQDVLLYFPFYESLAMRGKEGLLKHFGNASPPADGTTFEQANDLLQRRGYRSTSSRTCSSRREDRRGRLITAAAVVLTVVIPRCRYIPLETFEKVLLLRATAPRLSR
jgi:hypothetical protein